MHNRRRSRLLPIAWVAGAYFALSYPLWSATVTLQWDPNPVEDAIDHYTLKWGFVPWAARAPADNHEIQTGTATTYTITEPWSVGMTVYFVVTATNISNLESGPSNEVSFTVSPWNPAAPGHLKILDIDK